MHLDESGSRAQCIVAAFAIEDPRANTPNPVPLGSQGAHLKCGLGGMPQSREASGLRCAFRNQVHALIRGNAPNDLEDPALSLLTSRPWKRHSVESVLIQLRVNICSLEKTMPEYIGHLFKAGPAPYHLCRSRMPKRMSTQTASDDPCEFEVAFRNAADSCRPRNWAERRTCAYENVRLGTPWPSVSHVLRQGLSNIVRQRHFSFTRGFWRMDSKFSLSPIDIRELKTGDFSSAQREP